MSHHGMPRVVFTKQFRTPVQQVKRVIYPKLKPIQALAVALKIIGWLYVIPGGVAVAVPRLRGFLHRAVVPLQPLAELALGSLAVAIHFFRVATVISVLVPKVIAQQRWMVFVMLCQRHQEFLGCGTYFRIVQAKSRESTGCATPANAAVPNAAVAGEVASLRMLPEHPLRRSRY